MAFMMVATLSACADVNKVDRGDFGSFERSLNHKSYGYQLIDDPTGSAPTAQVERFEVRDGDCANDFTWSDCATHRERSEVKQPPKMRRLSEGTHQWYSWYIYVPKGTPSINPGNNCMAQFHNSGSNETAFMFQHGLGGYYFDNHLFRDANYVVLVPKGQFDGKWHHIEVEVFWSRNGQKGFVNVWANGDQKVAWKGVTLRAGDAYFKYGIYRSHLDRFDKVYPGKKHPTQIAMYAGVRAGETRADVQIPASNF